MFQTCFPSETNGIYTISRQNGELCMDSDDLPAVRFNPDIREKVLPQCCAELSHKKDACADPRLMQLPQSLPRGD